ncbi:mitochondrial ribosomal protein L44 [Lycorma delicatula]|uniref:mitochondrial ribosomal protein L44 n=1 Tax=Lycorma delicatula TaxID=130591 RepID=UPI003F50EEC5
MSVTLSHTCLRALQYTRSNFVQYRGFKRWLAPTLKLLKHKKDKMGPEPPIHRSALVEWNYNAELFAFSSRLSEDFDSSLLQQAFTTREYVINEIEKQRSVGIEDPQLKLIDNREMITSGEKIINAYLPRYLRLVFPKLPEEGIYAIQLHLTSEEILSYIGSNIGIGDLILTPEIPPTQSTLAKVFKAVIASLAESSGLDRANLFVRDFIMTQLIGKNINDLWEIDDPLKLLSDILERDGRKSFEPRLIGEAGRNTILAAYQVGLYVDKKLIGIGFGESIAAAKEMAARDVLQRLFETTETMRPIPFDLQICSDSSEPFANLSVHDWCEKNIKKLVKDI